MALQTVTYTAGMVNPPILNAQPGSTVTLTAGASSTATLMYFPQSNPNAVSQVNPSNFLTTSIGTLSNGASNSDIVTQYCYVMAVVTVGSAIVTITDPSLTTAPRSQCFASQTSFAGGPTGTVAGDTAVLASLLARGGAIKYNTPGVYLIGDGPTAGGTNGLLWSHLVNSDTSIEIGAGVTLRTQNPKSLFCNANIQSNRISVSAASFSDSTPFTNAVTVTVTCASTATLSASGYVMFKNDSSRILQGVYPIASIVNSTTFTFLHYGPNTASGSQSIGGSTICYPCDANIKVYGDGFIDYSGALTGAANLQLMGSIFNKVGNYYWNVRTTKSLKYGMYFCNIWQGTVGTPKAYNPSNPIQGVGPLHDIHWLPIYGESTDDPSALTTSNSGFTQYALKDNDGTQNSDGEIVRVEFDEINTSYNNSRSMLMYVDGAATAGDFVDIHFKRISNTLTSTTGAPVGGGACLIMGGSGTSGGNFKNVRIDLVTQAVPCLNNTAFPVQIGQSSDTAGFNWYGSIGRVENVQQSGGATTDGSQVGLVNVLGTGANGAQTVELEIDSLKSLVDTAGSSNVLVVSFQPQALSSLKVGSVNVKQVNPVYTSSPTTRNAMGVFFNPGVASKLWVGQVNVWGGLTAINTGTTADGHYVQVGRVYRDNGNTATQFGQVISHSGSVTATYDSVINHNGGYIFVGPNASKTFDVFVGQLIATNSSTLWTNATNASSVVRFGCNKIDMAISGSFGTFTPGSVQLTGNFICNNRGTTPLGFDANLLDSTMNNHAIGAMMWNTDATPNATQQGNGFPAASAIGLYQVSTVSGVLKWVRIGS